MTQRLHLLLIAREPAETAALIEQCETLREFSLHSASELPDFAHPSEAEQIDLVLFFQSTPAAWSSELRAKGYRGPILLLRSQAEEASAPEVIALPVRWATLIARIRATIRTYATQDSTFLSMGPFRLWPAAKILTSDDGTVLKLTEKEADILRFMHRAAGAFVSREVLLAEVWGYNAEVTTHTIETHIYRLRQKIERDPAQAALLVTEMGGYRLLTTGPRAAEEAPSWR